MQHKKHELNEITTKIDDVFSLYPNYPLAYRGDDL